MRRRSGRDCDPFRADSTCSPLSSPNASAGSRLFWKRSAGGFGCSPQPYRANLSHARRNEIAAAIERITPLQGLPFEERMWLARHGEEVVGQPGDILFEEGAPADRMMLILKGEIHVRRNRGGPMELFIGRAGQMTGLLPFSRMKQSGGQGFAISEVWALLIHQSIFPEMLVAIPSMAQRVVWTLARSRARSDLD